MDLITKSYVKEFLASNELTPLNESEDFERFASFCLVSNEYQGSFDIEDVLTDEGTQGIDSIGIVVNGRLVDEVDEVQDLLEANGFLDVTFVFLQAKSSAKFEGSEIGNFAYAVKEFFIPTRKINKGPRMQKFIAIKDHIYENAHTMRKGNPVCKMFYVTTGTWVEDASLKTVIDRNSHELFGTNLFSVVKIEPCDAKAIQQYYRKSKEKVSATFLFEKRVTLLPVRDIKEAYFGMLPFGEFRKLIMDESGNIKNIFYDNIRDFLGIEANAVNQKIHETLRSGNHDLFSVLNNGVTVVADNLTTTGDSFTLTDYQIVNGCQTSHVLYENREDSRIDSIYVPFRLIVTQDDNIKNEVTKATNRQTAVKPEQLESLSQFQKDLEQYYNSVEGDGRLYYERRTNQYGISPKVPRAKIISIPVQIKSFAAMFLDVPHLVSGYYGTIAKRLGNQIFQAEHKFIPYYTSGLAYYRLESLFRSRLLDPKSKKLRYHILMMVRMLFKPMPVLQFGSKEIETFCKDLIGEINSQENFLAYIYLALKIAEQSGMDITDKYQLKQKEKTSGLIDACNRASLKLH